MNDKHDHLAEATIEIVANLRTISASLRSQEPDTLKRWLLACELCREAGAVFSGNWDESPSPLQQVIEKTSDAVRYVSFNHAAGLLTLHPQHIATPTVDIPLAWFDEALLMVDSQWGSPNYPYEAPSRLEVAK